MRGAYFATGRLLKHVGTFQSLPRIFNVDLNDYVIGYTEINVMATTAFSRTKTHKGWFAGDALIENGHRIIDRVDNSRYLVMSVKDEYAGGDVIYKDGTLFKVNETCTINRFSKTLDAFGRVASDTLDLIASDVWVMVNPLVIDVIEQPDIIQDKDKIKLAMQSSIDIAVNDRVITSVGEKFKVVAFTRSEIEGLNMVHVVPDTR